VAKKIVVSAGDPSGDLILARVVREMKIKDPSLRFVGLCGEASKLEGVEQIAASSEVAVVGITEVLFHLPKIFSVLGKLKSELADAQLLLCVDFPDFNLKLSSMAKKIAVPVDYIIAPQVWAWRSERVHQIRDLVRTLYVALPFEEAYFRDRGVNAKFLGHPIRDLLPPKNRRAARAELGLSEENFVLAILPGSRTNEIKIQLPLMLLSFQRLLKSEKRLYFKTLPSDWTLVLPCAQGWNRERLSALLPSKLREFFDLMQSENKLRVIDNSRTALAAADFAWITSGTATLEAALYQIPHILLYKLSFLSEFLIRQSSAYFSDPNASAALPNILLEKKVIPELLQGDLNELRLAMDTAEILGNQTRMSEIKKPLRYLPKALGEVGACLRIADDIGSRLT